MGLSTTVRATVALMVPAGGTRQAGSLPSLRLTWSESPQRYKVRWLKQLRTLSPEPQANLMLARYYSSSIMRFLAVDPLSPSAIPVAPQTWNRYSYGANN